MLILSNFPNIYYAHEADSDPKTNSPLQRPSAFIHHIESIAGLE